MLRAFVLLRTEAFYLHEVQIKPSGGGALRREERVAGDRRRRIRLPEGQPVKHEVQIKPSGAAVDRLEECS